MVRGDVYVRCYNNIFRTWQLVVPEGLSGSYKIDLKATDHYGVEGLVANSADHLPIPQNERFVPGVWTGTMGDATFQPNRHFFLPLSRCPEEKRCKIFSRWFEASC